MVAGKFREELLVAPLGTRAFEGCRLAFFNQRGQGWVEFLNKAVETFVIAGQGTTEVSIGGCGANLFIQLGEVGVTERDVFHFAESDSSEKLASGLRGRVGFCESDFLVFNQFGRLFDVFEIGKRLEQRSINRGEFSGIGRFVLWRHLSGTGALSRQGWRCCGGRRW